MSELKSFNCDMHLHGPNSGGVSKYMAIPLIAEQAQLKGLDVMATGDCLDKDWLNHLKNNLTESKGCFKSEQYDTQFILGGELCDNRNVHQLFYFGNFDDVDLFREKLLKKGVRLDGKGFGRPWVKISAEELARYIIEDCNGLMGPAHAYTPYFAVYAHNDTLEACYGSMTPKIKFLELGLSADSEIADLMEVNHRLQYLSNSDAHSAWPDKIGREFNRMKMARGNFEEFKKVINLEDGRKIEQNIGLDAREGKYHCTACNNCFAKYTLSDAIKLKMKCVKCKGRIKRGVRDRALQLHNPRSKSKPSYRAPYLRSVPLAEIIRIAQNVKNTHSKKVQSIWRNLVESFESEIDVLLDVPIEKIQSIDAATAKKIQSFRNNWVLFISGGGGNYGVPIICDSEKEFQEKKIELEKTLDCVSDFKGQKLLAEF